MASVTGMTAEAIDARLGGMIVDADIDENGQMIFTKEDGSTVNAGPIIPPLIAVEAAHPVGSIYIGVTPTNPADLLGIGAWARFGKGRMLVSQDDLDPLFDTAQETGGEKEVTLTEAQMPVHDHVVNSFVADTGAGAIALQRAAVAPADVSQNSGGTTSEAGGGLAHNNLPPYIVVYMWRRTA